MAPQPRRGFGKLLAAPLLVLSLLSTLIVLSLTAWEVDELINNLNDILTDADSSTSSLDGFEGNAASFALIASALIAGVAAVGSYMAGLHHMRVWTIPSATAAQAAAWTAVGLQMLPFALVWKEIALGGDLGDNTRVTAVFVVLLTVLHFFYTLALYLPDQ